MIIGSYGKRELWCDLEASIRQLGLGYDKVKIRKRINES